jgi:hypothetical protein
MSYQTDMLHKAWSSMSRARLSARDIQEAGLITREVEEDLRTAAWNVMQAIDAALREIEITEARQNAAC